MVCQSVASHQVKLLAMQTLIRELLKEQSGVATLFARTLVPNMYCHLCNLQWNSMYRISLVIRPRFFYSF